MADTPYLTPAQYQRAAYDATCTSTMDGRTSINAGIEAVAMALEISAQQSGQFCSVTHHDAYLGFEALIRAQYNLWERPSDAYLQG